MKLDLNDKYVKLACKKLLNFKPYGNMLRDFDAIEKGSGQAIYDLIMKEAEFLKEVDKKNQEVLKRNKITIQ